MIRPPIRVLYIDLSNQSFEVKAHSDLADYFGGVGAGTKLLSECLGGDGGESKSEPFVLSTGPFCGLFPACSQTVASFVSPLTRNLGESFAGGKLGVSLRRTGIDCVFVSGKAKEPQVLVIEEGGVEFVPTRLWGRGAFRAAEALSRQYPDASVAVIGPAAEAGVRFSSVLVDRFFHFRRMGLGALWGRKRLKGLVVLGRGEISSPSSDLFSKVEAEITAEVSDPRPEGLKFKIRRGAEKTWLLEAEAGGLPIFNFRQTGAEYADLGRKLFSSVRRVGCAGCPISCQGIADCGEGEVSIDFESLASLGPLLGLKDPEEVFSLQYLAENLGMDPISLGAVLAFLTEKRGWEFGDFESYYSLITAIAEREEDWARELSLGLDRAAKKGGREFAMVFSRLEALPYFNGYLTVLSQILAPACGLWRSGAHLLDFSLAEGEVSDRERIQRLISEEKRGLLLFSLVGCPFVRGVYNLSRFFSCPESLGIGWSHEELETLASRVYNLRWKVKEQLGFSWEEIVIPERVFELESATGYLERERLEGMIEMYRENIGV